MLAAGRIRSDGAGFHVLCPIKGKLDTVIAGLGKHHRGGLTGGELPRIKQLLFRNYFLGGYFFFVWHIIPPFLELAIYIKLG
jgi:hypothetical protein